MKKTKEEILEHHYRGYNKRIAYPENVLSAMEEYKSQSIPTERSCKDELGEILDRLKTKHKPADLIMYQLGWRDCYEYFMSKLNGTK
jgi:hypothetical protein